jgi:hypothetical protein
MESVGEYGDHSGAIKENKKRQRIIVGVFSN